MENQNFGLDEQNNAQKNQPAHTIELANTIQPTQTDAQTLPAQPVENQPNVKKSKYVLPRSRRIFFTTFISVVIVIVLIVGILMGYGLAYNQYYKALQPESPNQVSGQVSKTDDGSLSSQQANDFPEYYSQTINWSEVSCSTITSGDVVDPNYQCALIKAPLDWTRPTAGEGMAKAYSLADFPYDSDDQGSINLALIRYSPHAATSSAPAQADSLPYLFTNPGGPGGGGIDFVSGSSFAKFSTALKAAYTISAWDPRGTGYSTSVHCWTDDQTKIKDLIKTVPGEMPANFEANKAETIEFTDGCKQNTGSLIKYVGTESTVRDLDLIRSVVTKSKLNYIGFSYGTYIGQVYAGLFPEQTARFVLDGIDDADLSDFEHILAQTKGFETAITSYLTDCINNQGQTCPFAGKDVAFGSQWISASIKSLHNKPLQTTDGREFNDVSFTYAVITPLYSKENWKYLSLGLLAFKKTGDLSVLQLLADSYFSYDSKTGKFDDNTMDANSPIDCSDSNAKKILNGDDSKYDLVKSQNEHDQLVVASPTFGDAFAWGGLSCDYFPADSSQIRYDISTDSTPPVLLVGATKDPATPYQSAVNVHNKMKNSVLLSSDSDGHCSYLTGSDAVRNVVDQYLITGVMPQDGQMLK
jgi:pimeloyl-ACP methyl ester carboxylesterase